MIRITMAMLECAAQARRAPMSTLSVVSPVAAASSVRIVGAFSAGARESRRMCKASSISPRPIATRPRSRVRVCLPRRKAMTPIASSAGAISETLKDSAWTMRVVPTLAPSMTANAGTNVTMPPAVKEVTMSPVAVLLCRSAVAPTPTRKAVKRLRRATLRNRRRSAPKARTIPLPTMCMPQSSSATPPIRSRRMKLAVVLPSTRAKPEHIQRSGKLRREVWTKKPYFCAGSRLLPQARQGRPAGRRACRPLLPLDPEAMIALLLRRPRGRTPERQVIITVHHLENSRSQRILWLLEELGLDYALKRYARDPATMLAPAALRAVHPLGKSPVISDDGQTLAESGAIVEYLVGRYGGGRLAPPPDTPERLRYTYWLHYAEGSAMPPLLLKLVFDRMPKGPMPALLRPLVRRIAERARRGFVDPQIALHLNYLEGELGRSAWFAGDAFTAADIQMSFPLEAAAARGGLDATRPRLWSFLERSYARPPLSSAR